MADVTELGIALATVTTGGEQAKTVLGAISTAVKGGRLSVDQNFFREKATESIVASMRAARAEIRTRIEESRPLPVDEYSLEAAIVDLTELYYSGTLEEGLLRLSQMAGSKAETEEVKARQTVLDRISEVTEAQLGDSALIRKTFNEWHHAGKTENAINALTTLQPPKEGAKLYTEMNNEELFKALNAELKKARSDPSYLAKVKAAMKL